MNITEQKTIDAYNELSEKIDLATSEVCKKYGIVKKETSFSCWETIHKFNCNVSVEIADEKIEMPLLGGVV
jgi:hypothetical protein